MRLGNIVSALLIAATTSFAHADAFKVGPISIGSGSPFGGGQILFGDADTGIAEIDFRGIPDLPAFGYNTYTATSAFSFDLDPGYQITSIALYTGIVGAQPATATDSSANVRVSVSTCTQSDACNFAGFTRQFGNSLPPLEPLAVAGAGTGILQYDIETLDYSYSEEGNYGILRYGYTDVAATPEPSSIALLGTGLLSMVGVIRRRLAR